MNTFTHFLSCCLYAYIYASILFVPISVYAQTSMVDKLRKQLAEAKTDTAKIDILNDLGFQYIFSNLDTADIYIEQAFTLSKKINYTTGIASAYNYRGILNRSQGNYIEAIEYHLKGLDLYEKKGHAIGIANSYINMGLVHAIQGHYEQAVAYYQKCADIKRKVGDMEGVANAYNDMGDIHTKKGEYEKALKFYFDTYEIRKKVSKNDTISIAAATYKSVGIVYELQQENEKALDYLLKVIPFYERENDYNGIANIYNHIGNVYLNKKDYTKAIVHYEKAIKIAEVKKLRLELRDSYQGLSKSYFAQGDFKNAHHYSNAYADIQALLFNAENNQKMAQMQASFSNKKKQIEIELLKKENALQGVQTTALAIGIGLVLIIAGILLYNNRRKQKTNQLLTYQKQTIETARKELELKNEHITASIKYAQRMQTAVLPFDEKIKLYLPNFFILFKPKDIVSGDFYWFQSISTAEGFDEADDSLQQMIFAVADCTGHGVPGAILSMIGSFLLNDIVNRKKITSPADILLELHRQVQYALKQHEQGNDGMDIGICLIENKGSTDKQITYAGAKRPLYYLAYPETELRKIEPDRKSIGGFQNEVLNFTNKTLSLPPKSRLYLSTDGYIDQNNEKRKRLGEAKFVKIIADTAQKDLVIQKTVLSQALEAHQQKSSQRDDILVVGISL